MEKPILRLVFAMSTFGALVAACSSGGSSGAATRDSFVASYCDLLAPCCAKAGYRSDGAQCRAFAGGLAPSGYDPVAGEACLNEMRAASADPSFCDDFGESNAPSCESVFPSEGSGTREPGETCTDDDECKRSSEGKVECASATVTGGGAEIRKCQVVLRGTEGSSPCAGTKEGNVTYYTVFRDDVPSKAYLCHTSDGLRCDSSSGACVKIPGIGEECSFGSASCVEGAYCEAGTCVARKAVGEDCTFGDECVESAYCDSDTNRCTAKLADGEPCTSSSRCASGACVNGKCDKSSSGNFALALLCGND